MKKKGEGVGNFIILSLIFGIVFFWVDGGRGSWVPGF